MCRWIALISKEPIILEDVLVNAQHSITKQIHTHFIHHVTPSPPKESDFDEGNVKYNLDGFGVTWYTNTRSEFDNNTRGPYPSSYKTAAQPINDPTFTSICANSASKCFLAHARAASRPPVTWTNNHPFVFGRHSFMHNGSIAEFSKVRLEILKKISPEYTAMIWGNTDTEHLAALYFTYLGDIQKQYSARLMREALALAIKEVLSIQVRVLGQSAPNSLNICTTDGENLVVLRYRNNPIGPDGDQSYAPAVYVSYNAAASLNRKHKDDPWHTNLTECAAEDFSSTSEVSKAASEQLQYSWPNPHGPHVILASDPTNFVKGQWFTMYNRQFIMVDKTKLDHEVGTDGSNIDNAVTFDRLEI